jgi:hypothetical protein
LLCFVVLQALSQTDSDAKTCRLCPEVWQVQFAGNLGFVSAGAGYDLFKDKLRAVAVYGYVPKRFTGTTAIHMFSLKSMVPLVRIQATEALVLSPYVGAAGTLEPGRHSILVLPDWYPKKYYGTMAFHFTGIGGLSVSVPGARSGLKNLELYGECVVLDTMLWYKLNQDEVSTARLLSAAIGITGKF